MMALSLIGEVISQNVVDVRALPCLANWGSFAIGVCCGTSLVAGLMLIMEARHAR